MTALLGVNQISPSISTDHIPHDDMLNQKLDITLQQIKEHCICLERSSKHIKSTRVGIGEVTESNREEDD